MIKSLILGTAMWGWTLSEKQCFQLMDEFYAAGFRQVDAATNYPINKKPEDFRAAENILLEWIRANGIRDLEVIIKVGSINNLRSPEHNLRKSFLLLNLDDYSHRFGDNLHTFMVHWDNRDDKTAIGSTLEVLQIATQRAYQAGLSGIKHPEIYKELNEQFQLEFRIQAKHNLLQSDLERYAPLEDKAQFLAYGINAGGVKLQSTAYRKDSNLIVRGGSAQHIPLLDRLQELLPGWQERKLPEPLGRFNQIGMIYAYHQPRISGILIGPSKPEQLKKTLTFFQHLQSDQYLPVYQDLKALE